MELPSNLWSYTFNIVDRLFLYCAPRIHNILSMRQNVQWGLKGLFLSGVIYQTADISKLSNDVMMFVVYISSVPADLSYPPRPMTSRHDVCCLDLQRPADLSYPSRPMTSWCLLFRSPVHSWLITSRLPSAWRTLSTSSS